MIIDFHTHIFPKKIRSNREKFFNNEPEFKLLYESPKSKMVGAADMILNMDETGVDKAVIFGFPWHSYDTFRLNNDFIMESVDRYPDRFIGMCCLDPFHEKAEQETIRCIQGGLSGVGELAFYESGFDGYTLNKLAPIMKICLEKNLPILIHTNEPVGHKYPGKAPITLLEIENLAVRFPDNNIVLAHWGGGIFFFNLLKKVMKEHLKNIYFDTAASPYLYDASIYRLAMEIAGEGKILFGSDYPLICPKRYFNEFEKSGLTDEQISRISGINAAKILNIGL
ncbi:MAG: amidohydrolase family protein [Desulfobacterales bacterium]|nr:amidohydrolase family protein [Desulfobacterales bacterium]